MHVFIMDIALINYSIQSSCLHKQRPTLAAFSFLSMAVNRLRLLFRPSLIFRIYQNLWWARPFCNWLWVLVKEREAVWKIGLSGIHVLPLLESLIFRLKKCMFLHSWIRSKKKSTQNNELFHYWNIINYLGFIDILFY